MTTFRFAGTPREFFALSDPFWQRVVEATSIPWPGGFLYAAPHVSHAMEEEDGSVGFAQVAGAWTMETIPRGFVNDTTCPLCGGPMGGEFVRCPACFEAAFLYGDPDADPPEGILYHAENGEDPENQP